MVRRDDKKIFYPEADAALLSKVEYTGLILRPYRFGHIDRKFETNVPMKRT